MHILTGMTQHVRAGAMKTTPIAQTTLAGYGGSGARAFTMPFKIGNQNKKRKITVASLFNERPMGKREMTEDERAIPEAPPPSEQR